MSNLHTSLLAATLTAATSIFVGCDKETSQTQSTRRAPETSNDAQHASDRSAGQAPTAEPGSVSGTNNARSGLGTTGTEPSGTNLRAPLTTAPATTQAAAPTP